MTWTLVMLRGLEQIMLDMVDDPDGLHRLMAFLRDGHLARLDFLEAERPAQPEQRRHVRRLGRVRLDARAAAAGLRRAACARSDMWGFGESQETVGVSPAMFGEFVFPYQLPLLERFGLNCYGCCEPLDKRWHVRRADPAPAAHVGLGLGGRADAWPRSSATATSSRGSPDPADLAMPALRRGRDPRATCARLRIAAPRDCRVEVIMKDNHTIGNDPERVVRWVQIAREEAESA